MLPVSAHDAAACDLDGAVDGECAVCGRVRLLVAPPCTEGHGADCPDRICAECGTAVFLNPVLASADPSGNVLRSCEAAAAGRRSRPVRQSYRA
jgi:hypothetical protein